MLVMPRPELSPRELMEQADTYIIADFMLSSLYGRPSNAWLGPFICCHIGRRRRRGQNYHAGMTLFFKDHAKRG